MIYFSFQPRCINAPCSAHENEAWAAKNRGWLVTQPRASVCLPSNGQELDFQVFLGLGNHATVLLDAVRPDAKVKSFGIPTDV